MEPWLLALGGIGFTLIGFGTLCLTTWTDALIGKWILQALIGVGPPRTGGKPRFNWLRLMASLIMLVGIVMLVVSAVQSLV